MFWTVGEHADRSREDPPFSKFMLSLAQRDTSEGADFFIT